MGHSADQPMTRKEGAVLVGGRIRKVRKQKGLSISELSRQAGVSTGHLSQIERDIIEPSLTVLQKLSKALKTHISVFFDDNNCGDLFITTPESRQAMSFSDTSLSWQMLTPVTRQDGSKPGFTAHISTIPANQTDLDEMSVHKSYYEMIYLIEGSYRYLTEEGDLPMSEGDGVFIPLGIEHKGQNEQDSAARLLVVAIYDKK